jgi:hypothetical protein
MSTIRYDGYENITPSEFLDACSKSEKEDLIDLLIQRKTNGYRKFRTNPMEGEFEKAVDKLHGSYSHLTKEETKTIIGIAGKCIE